MPTHVVLVGAGGIGRRHLQALTLTATPLRIYVVDPSADALTTARGTVSTGLDLHSISYHSKPVELPPEVDVAIVATTADVRRQALDELLERSRPRYLILEKVLFQRFDDYGAVSRRLRDEGIAAWVNCPRRLWPQYQKLRAKLTCREPLAIHVRSNQATGLGANSIHMLDLLAFLTGSRDVEVDGSRLHLCEGPAKRGGIEFVGTLVAHAPNGSVLTYAGLPCATNHLRLDIKLPGFRIAFEEHAGRGWQSAAENDWHWQGFDAPAVLQSRLTNTVVDQLVTQGTCGLPGYDESARIHLPLLAALATRLEALGIASCGEVRIT